MHCGFHLQLVACYEVQACHKIPSMYKRDLHAVGDLLSSGLLLVVLKNGPHAPGLSRAILDARSMLTVVGFQGSVAASADAVSGMISYTVIIAELTLSQTPKGIQRLYLCSYLTGLETLFLLW